MSQESRPQNHQGQINGPNQFLYGKIAAKHTLRRSIPRPRKTGKIAFVLSGGGNRGAVQVGMLRALVERGIYPDFILGASVGALNGVGYATDPSHGALERLNDLWIGLSKDAVFPPQRFGATWRYAQRRPFVYPNHALEAVIRQSVTIADLSDTVIPMEIVITNAATGEPKRLTSGDPVKALLATSALPGTFPPIEIDGSLFIDGGVSDDVPLLRAADLGADTIYVLYCGSLQRIGRTRNRPIEAVLESFALAKLARFRADLATLGDRATAVVLQSTAADNIPWLDYSRSSQMIDDGYLSAVATLSALESSKIASRRWRTDKKAAFSTIQVAQQF